MAPVRRAVRWVLGAQPAVDAVGLQPLLRPEPAQQAGELAVQRAAPLAFRRCLADARGAAGDLAVRGTRLVDGDLVVSPRDAPRLVEHRKPAERPHRA